MQFIMDEFLKHLADLIILETNKLGVSYSCFAELCGISRNEIDSIINHRKKDLYVSTILKICQNSNISYLDLFSLEKTYEIN